MFIGRLNKKETLWLEGRQDVTQDFLSCCIQYFTPGKKNCITVDGEVKYVIAVREPEPGETFDIEGENS